MPDIGLFLMATGMRGAVTTSILYVAEAVPLYAASALGSLVKLMS